MSATDLALARLKVEEGFRAQLYKDTVGKSTIGYGFNVDAGITDYAATALLNAQIQERDTALLPFWWYSPLNDARKSVFIDVSFNVGINGLLHFPKCISAVGAGNWQVAHDELLNSDAARMLPSRYGPLASILLSGA
jgi:lysozyme